MKKLVSKLMMTATILALALSLSACFEPKAKTFSSSGFTVTLNDSFHEKEYISFNLYLESRDILFTGLMENGAGVVSTLTAYTNMVISNNSLSNVTVNNETGDDGIAFKHFIYEKTVSGKDFTYLGVTKAGSGTKFYLFNFACESKNYEKLQNKMLGFAKTITVE